MNLMYFKHFNRNNKKKKKSPPVQLVAFVELAIQMKDIFMYQAVNMFILL